jgi:GxxExxY protein
VSRISTGRIPFERQVGVPIIYKGVRLEDGLGADVVVDHAVILEFNAVSAIIPAHEAHLQTYSACAVSASDQFSTSTPYV